MALLTDKDALAVAEFIGEKLGECPFVILYRSEGQICTLGNVDTKGAELLVKIFRERGVQTHLSESVALRGQA